METSYVASVAELVEYVTQHDTDFNGNRRILWFRGQHSSEWHVLPSIWRDYDPDEERNFTNRFRSRAATRLQTVPNYDNHAVWLSLMQHYGLPTRLLDWTRSPLIAAYFAIEPYIYKRGLSPQDAAIWILKPHQLNVMEDNMEYTPAIDAHMCNKMLAPAFIHDKLENGKVLAVMAAERDLRMFVQQGCFTIHSDREPLDIRENHHAYLTQLIIPADRVEWLAAEIDRCGFRKGDIYPDLGHLADELRELNHP